jgi:eukaryotic-like serine/threonine-protein kinase
LHPPLPVACQKCQRVGTPQVLTTLNAVKNEHGHLWPYFLPDGIHFIFFVASDSGASTGVYAGSVDSPNYSLLFISKTNAVYSVGR